MDRSIDQFPDIIIFCKIYGIPVVTMGNKVLFSVDTILSVYLFSVFIMGSIYKSDIGFVVLFYYQDLSISIFENKDINILFFVQFSETNNKNEFGNREIKIIFMIVAVFIFMMVV